MKTTEDLEQNFSRWRLGWMAGSSWGPTDPAFAEDVDYRLGYFFGHQAFMEYCDMERERRGLPPIRSYKRN